MDKLDDTINLSELNPIDRSPEQNGIHFLCIKLRIKLGRRMHTEEQQQSPEVNSHMNGELRRNLSQLSISQIAIEPNVIHNTEMSQAH